MMTREEFRIKNRQTELDFDMKRVDPKMPCFGNALADVARTISILDLQYKNADTCLDEALASLKTAYEAVASAYKNARRNSLCIDDYVNYIKPDYVSVNNAEGMTYGHTAVETAQVEADVDGVHMYFTI